jgi:hypothetical protein
MRTYLYVDGENFAIRAGHLDAALKAQPRQAEALKQRANVRGVQWEHANTKSDIWCPEPHRSAMNSPRTEHGLLYSKDEVYWDSAGLFIALMATAMDHVGYSGPMINRGYYFASASGTRKEQHARDLHALGFSPDVSTRIKPDSWAKQKASEGITVISRPKPVDILIATQVLEDCMADNFDECIFVGGDEDFVPLLQAVRRRGKRVVLVAFERWLADDQRLRFVCDRFVPYDPVLAVRPLPSAPLAPVDDTAT